MDFLAFNLSEPINLATAIPAAIGGAVGAFVASLSAVRKRWRREATTVVRDAIREHLRTCPAARTTPQ